MSLFFTRPDRFLRLGTFPRPETVHIAIGGAPEFMNPLRALFVSDIHLRPGVSDARLRALVDQLGAQQADLILLGGDYAETPADCLRFFRAFASLRPRLGTYAVCGNNDLDSLDSLRETMRRANVTFLRNESVRLELPGGALEIGGCDDHKYGAPRTAGLFSPDRDAYRILLSHFPIKPDCACRLMLSGHTHAGQFNLLGLTPYSLGFEFRHRLMGVRGLRRFGDMRLLIGNGVGVSRFPLRLGAAPQIYLLKFANEDFC